MSNTGKRKPPLVADKRPRAGAKKPVKRKPAKRPPARRTRRKRGNPIVGFFRSIFGWFFRLTWRLFWRGAVVVGLISGAAIWYFSSTIPDLEHLLDARTGGSVTMMDRNGEVFAWRGKQFGGQVTAGNVAPVLRNAVVATEDKRFYRHLGVSPRGIASAIRINLREGRGPLSGHGGSTITQQVAKLICLGVPFNKNT